MARHGQDPLTQHEVAPLWRRERLVGWLQIAAMAAFLLAGAVGYRDGAVTWLGYPLLASVLVLLFAAAVLQFGARCPRCGARLRSKILKMLPDNCAACGVELPRPPSA
jgi:hypothetical protein